MSDIGQTETTNEMKNNYKITFSSCFYIVNSKFEKEKYIEWMNNIIYIANNFNLVIYTNAKSRKYIDTKQKKNIKVIIKEFSEFYNYKYKTSWINNHNINSHFNSSGYNTDWELNMLWSEKIWLVSETANSRYFDTNLYGWCDIGYFRNRPNDLPIYKLVDWPDDSIVKKLDTNKIHYGCVADNETMNALNRIIQKKTKHDIPVRQIPPEQNSVCGGFFIINKFMIGWWAFQYDTKLKAYFRNNYLVKDDQIIIVDCILSKPQHFCLQRDLESEHDPWFVFQGLLMNTRGPNICKSYHGYNTNKSYNNMISILMPIYNGIEFIDESVMSVVYQSYNNWELLIGVNGHPENSEIYKIAKKYEELSSHNSNDDTRQIKVYDLHRIKGKPNALNELTQYSRGEYIALLDVDDIWKTIKLEIQSKYISNYDVVGTNCIYIGDKPGITAGIPLGDISDFDFNILNPVINSSSIIKKNLCYWNNVFTEDYDLWKRLRQNECTFYNCEDILVFHRIHNASFFNSKSRNIRLQLQKPTQQSIKHPIQHYYKSFTFTHTLTISQPLSLSKSILHQLFGNKSDVS